MRLLGRCSSIVCVLVQLAIVLVRQCDVVSLEL